MAIARYADVAVLTAVALGLVLTRNAFQDAYKAGVLTPTLALALTLALACASRLVSRKATTGKWLALHPLTQRQWQNQVAIISGGCGGLGSALCKTLRDRGCKAVYALDIRPPSDVELQKDEAFHWIECDLSSSEAIFNATRKIAHKPTILILNAAINHLAPLAEQSPHQLTTTINVNLTSALHLLHIYPYTAHTILISSVMGISGVKDMEVYVASKYALVGLYESMLRSTRGETSISLILPCHISTQLFSYWKYPFPFNYITPTLTPDYVARICVEEIHARRTRRVYMPPLTVGMELLGFSCVPAWCKELAVWCSGSDHAVQDMRRAREEEQAKQ